LELSDRKKEIIDAALSLLNEQGIQELTMKRIASAVGVSEPALYRHFPSKSEILSAVVDAMELSRAQALKAARTAGAEAEGTLMAFFENHALLFTKRPAMTTILFSEDLFQHDASLLIRVARIIAETQHLIQGEIEKGKKVKAFRPGIDTENASLMLLGGFRLLVSKWRLEHYSFDLVTRTNSYMRSIFLLLKA